MADDQRVRIRIETFHPIAVEFLIHAQPLALLALFVENAEFGFAPDADVAAELQRVRGGGVVALGRGDSGEKADAKDGRAKKTMEPETAVTRAGRWLVVVGHGFESRG